MERQRRRGHRQGRPSVWAGLLLLLLVAYRVWVSQSAPVPVTEEGFYRVQRVVDGDTLILDGGSRVRLLGVDTPETKDPHRPVQLLGPEAAEFTRKHVEGRRVKLQFDRERKDRYDRLLAYLFIDDWFLNEELIRHGFSRAQLQYPYSAAMKRRFRAAEEQARRARAGLWAEISTPSSRAVR